MVGKVRGKNGCAAIVATAIFCVVLMAIVVGMNVKSNIEQTHILEESVETQLVSIAVAARETIDVDAFMQYNSEKDVEANGEMYAATLRQLRALATNVGAKYIYALKEIDGKYYFVFDTDTVDDAIFVEYELMPVQQDAFRGIGGADVSGVEDAYGKFNIAAVPIWKDGAVVGIVCADIEDTFLQQNRNVIWRNTILLVGVLVVTMGALLAAVIVLVRRVGIMQEKLQHQAHYDTITGLPNRQYLLDYLAKITSDTKHAPFALLFIDLDNFKAVNDGAGHDAGDELLCHVARCLELDGENAKSFRPAAGILNIAARVGGDEFVQVVTGIDNEKAAREAAQRLLDHFAENASSNRYVEKYDVGLSVGVALYPYHTENYHVLIKYADVAMYDAKRQGKHRYSIYKDEMNKE